MSSDRKLAVEPPRHGVAPIKPRASVKYAELDPLISPLPLEPSVANELKRAIRDIMSDYLGPAILAGRTASHAQSLKLLPMIARVSSELVDHLNEIDQSFLAKLDDHRSEVVPAHQDHAYFHFPLLIKQLRQLSAAAARVGQIEKPRSRGNSHNIRLDNAVERLIAAVNNAGLSVDRTEAGASVPRKRVNGSGAELIKSVFAKFDGRVGAPEIFGAMARLKAEAERQSRPK